MATDPTSINLQNRALGRLKVVGAFSIRQLAAPVSALLLSLLVIRLAGPEAWGVFVGPLLFVALGVQVVQWGSREYLLRAFSRNPSDMGRLWQQNFRTRLLLLPPMALLLAWQFGNTLGGGLFVAVWLLSAVVAQSLDVWVAYHRRFGLALVGEAFQFGAIILGILLHPEGMAYQNLLLWWAIGHVLKATWLLWNFRGEIGKPVGWQKDWSHIVDALPMFLLSFAGLVQSRIDLYIVSFLSPEAEVARYQMAISILLQVQAVAGFILIPYARNLYRLQSGGIRATQFRLATLGLPVSIAGSVVTFGSLYLVVGFNYSWHFWLLGAVFAWPIFYYLPLIYLMYGMSLERSVLLVLVACIAIGALLCLLLLPLYGIVGALAAVATAQWVIMACLGVLARKNMSL